MYDQTNARHRPHRRIHEGRRNHPTGLRVALLLAGAMTALAFLPVGLAEASPDAGWTYSQRIPSPEEIEERHFGASLAISDGLAIIGAPTGNFGDHPGAAHVYTVDDGHLTPHTVLEPWDATPAADGFGADVALSDKLAVVAAPYAGGDAGAVYVYRRSGSRLVAEVKLTAPGSYRFGSTVGIAGQRVVVGSDAAVHVFHKVDRTWRREATLPGGTVAAERDRIAIRRIDGINVFVRDGDLWRNEAHLVASTEDPLGQSGGFALGGRVIVAGAPYVGEWDESKGVAHVFRQTVGGWHAEEVLTVPEGTPPDAYSWYGVAAAVEGDTMVAGRVENLGDWGVAYVYEHRRGRWVEVAQLVSDPPMPDGWFGTQIALSGDTMLVAESGIGGRPGFVHVYVNRDDRRTEE